MRKNGVLIFVPENGKEQVLFNDLPYAILQVKKKEREKNIEFRNGTLKIVAFEKKSKPIKMDESVTSYHEYLNSH